MLDLVLALSGLAQISAANNGSSLSVSHKRSAAEAADEILTKNPNAKVIGFGEISPYQRYSVKYSIQRFSDEVLPVLARKGIKDLVLEAVLTDPQIKSELEAFYRTGRIHFPRLRRGVGCDYNGYVALFKKARALGVRVHPGGISWSEAQATIFLPSFGSLSLSLGKIAAKYLARRLMKAVSRLYRAGRRVAFYAGYLHNNSIPQRNSRVATREIYLGIPLRRKLGKNYVEVDMFVPYAIQKEGQGRFIGFPNWRKHVPKSGVNLIKTRNLRYIILYP